jgi:hypothetical protein
MLLQHATCEKVNRNQEAAIVIFEESKKIAPGQMEIAKPVHLRVVYALESEWCAGLAMGERQEPDAKAAIEQKRTMCKKIRTASPPRAWVMDTSSCSIWFSRTGLYSSSWVSSASQGIW